MFLPPSTTSPCRQILAEKLWLLDIQALVEWESPEVLQQQGWVRGFLTISATETMAASQLCEPRIGGRAEEVLQQE